MGQHGSNAVITTRRCYRTEIHMWPPHNHQIHPSASRYIKTWETWVMVGKTWVNMVGMWWSPRDGATGLKSTCDHRTTTRSTQVHCTEYSKMTNSIIHFNINTILKLTTNYLGIYFLQFTYLQIFKHLLDRQQYPQCQRFQMTSQHLSLPVHHLPVLGNF